MKIYKYRKFNENTLKLLINNSIHFSRPIDFNDPFDSRILYEEKNNINDLTKFYNNSYKQGLISENNIKSWINLSSKIKKLKNRAKFEKDICAEKNKFYQINLLISCFASISNCIQMWSHYAENHTGICIGFSTLNFENNEWILLEDNKIKSFKIINKLNAIPVYPVNYSSKCPNPINENTKDIIDQCIKFILTKENKWNYENELRSIINNNNINNPIKFNKNSLCEIYLGLKMSKEIQKVIINLIEKYYLINNIDVNLFKMKMSDKDYYLHPEIIKL